MLAAELWRSLKLLEKIKTRERGRERQKKGELQYELMQSEYTSIEKKRKEGLKELEMNR